MPRPKSGSRETEDRATTHNGLPNNQKHPINERRQFPSFYDRPWMVAPLDSETPEKSYAPSEREYRARKDIRLAEMILFGRRYRLWGYDVNSSALKVPHLILLNELSNLLSLEPLASILLIGHASRSGKFDLNEYLSRERAEIAAGELIRLGVDVEQIKVEWRSFDEPLISETGAPASMARNRRVEIRIQMPKEPEKRIDLRPSCKQASVMLRFYLGLRSAWSLSIGRGRFRDTGDPMVKVKPDRRHFIVAMGAQRFTPDERMKIWKWYPGELAPNGGHDFLMEKADRAIEWHKAALKNCSKSREWKPGWEYDVPDVRRQKI